MDRRLSEAAFERARQSIPGGVSSPVRSFRAVGLPPLVASRAEGAYFFDVDGNRYVDHLMSWGAIILGHAAPEVDAAVRRAASRGISYGLSTEPEAELAELIREAFPSVELVRLVNSGTEAVMSTVRLARGFTGRSKVIVFEGGYHGHSDGLLVRAGSGVATFSVPGSAGVPASVVGDTLVARYNDLGSVASLCREHDGDVACVLVEPVAGNMGVVPPKPGFLKGLRELCDRTGALLVFDEVITGFRIARGGAQERFGIRADLTTLGKVIGGGLPVGAFGGRRDVMEQLTPLGDVYQAGTLAGNPVVASAGAAALRALGDNPPYPQLERRTSELVSLLEDAASAAGVPLRVNRVGSMFTCFFTGGEVADYVGVRQADTERYAAFFRGMLDRGVLLPPSQFEAAFVSAAHSDADIALTTGTAAEVLRSL